MEIKVLTDTKGPKISKYIYGQFAEHLGRGIYEGVWVGPDSHIPNDNGIRIDVVEALKEINVPLVRWPGGLFADEYHWKDGIGPREERKKIVNTNWGQTVENNHFGTHEFFYFLELIGAEAYINGNLGSGTVQEMQEWIEYMTFAGESPMANLRRENGQDVPWDVPFFGIGNENWGGGGHMRPEFYSDLYRQYQTYIKNEGIYKIACGPNGDDYNWTEQLMKIAGPFMDGLSLHYYAMPSDWKDKRPATGFPEEEWVYLIDSAYKMENYITKHSSIMDKYDPEKRVGLIVDEWGAWYAVEEGTKPGYLYQQNTIRDAVLASITLNIFHRHADRVHMANIAQMVNVLQAMLLTNGANLIKTPTYHVFDMYKHHQDAMFIETYGNKSELVDYTISKKNNTLAISIVNANIKKDEKITLDVGGLNNKNSKAWILTADEIDAHNSFDNPDNVCKRIFTDYIIQEEKLNITLPSKSIITLLVNVSE